MRSAILQQVKRHSSVFGVSRAVARKPVASVVGNTRRASDLQPWAETVCVESQAVSPYLVDVLAEEQRDWISLLQLSWQIDPSSFRLAGVQLLKGDLTSEAFTLKSLVAMTENADRQSMITFQKRYWVYTLCVQIVGLGRVRLVISCDTPGSTKDYTVFATNRLDWSPRMIMTQWVQHHSLSYSREQMSGKRSPL
jgi:hypothetical protein